jgi:hypothetical protein
LPADYLPLLGEHRDLGSRLIEIWPADEVLRVADGEPRYDDVLLFAGDGANTVYGFDARRGGEIVEGDWIGLDRSELIPHGRTLAELFAALGEIQ